MASQTITEKVKALIRDFNGIKEPAREIISFPCGVLADGRVFELELHLRPMPSHALLDCLREDLEYLRKAH